MLGKAGATHSAKNPVSGTGRKVFVWSALSEHATLLQFAVTVRPRCGGPIQRVEYNEKFFKKGGNAMKIDTIFVRTLLGLLFIFASITYFFNLVPQPKMTDLRKAFNEGLQAVGYFMPLLKVTELVC